MPYINDKIRVSIETFEDLDMNPAQVNFYNFLRECLQKGNSLLFTVLVLRNKINLLLFQL